METYVINRAVAIIKPRQPYLEWANRIAQSDEPLEEFVKSSRVILIPTAAYDELERFLKENYSRIFEMELESWVPDESDWPARRDYDTFTEWFEVEAYALVVDTADDEIVREPYDGEQGPIFTGTIE